MEFIKKHFVDICLVVIAGYTLILAIATLRELNVL